MRVANVIKIQEPIKTGPLVGQRATLAFAVTELCDANLNSVERVNQLQDILVCSCEASGEGIEKRSGLAVARGTASVSVGLTGRM